MRKITLLRAGFAVGQAAACDDESTTPNRQLFDASA